MVRDVKIGRPEHESLNQDNAVVGALEDVYQALKALGTTTVVSCPISPSPIPGSDSATALESGDTVGNVFRLAVPKSGVIISATLFDYDDEGTQIDLEIYKARIADVAVDAAYAPTDIEGLTFVCELSFVSFDDHGVFQTSQLTNIGQAYTVSGGFLYFQAVTRSTPTIAAGVPHRIQLQIQSFDPTFKES